MVLFRHENKIHFSVAARDTEERETHRQRDKKTHKETRECATKRRRNELGATLSLEG